MKLIDKPSWSRLIIDGAIVLAAIFGAVYVLSIDAGAAEAEAPISVETPE